MVAPEGKPFGWQDPKEWDAFGAWMQEKNLLEQPPDVPASYDNSLLPGSGLQPDAAVTWPRLAAY